MKKVKLFLIMTVLLVAAIPLPTQATPNYEKDMVAVSRINSKNGSEFVEFYNYSSQSIDVMKLNVKAFGSTGTQNFSKTFSSVTLLNNNFILIAQGGTKDNSDENYAASSNNITPNGGRVETYFDSELVSEICWGSVACDNHVDISDNAIFITDACQADKNCSEASMRFGGVVAAIMCQFDNKIFASDENCVDPDAGSDDSQGGTGDGNTGDDNEPKPNANDNCSQLKLSEIGANLDEQFIEIINPTSEPVNLAGCGLATNRNAKTFIFGDEILPAGAVRLVKITDSGLTLSKTVSGKVYLLASDGSEILGVTYPIPKSGASYAFVDDDWQENQKPTPNQVNTPEIVNYCEGLELSEIAANVDNQFIEIYNPTVHDIDMTDCQLTTNRNNNAKILDGTLSGGNYLTIYIKDTTLTLTKTTTGTVYLLSSDGKKEINQETYSGLSKETAWALVDGIWRQTYELTPDAANVWVAYPACPSGQERNLETGRCRKILVEEEAKPCAEGQYRNPLTNRCKKYEVVSALAPCKEGYERNPETNRCRKIVVEEGLKPCAEGWERNPETNRCRKKVSTTPAAFAVQPSNPTGIGATYMLVGAGVLAVTIGVTLFQFRTELARAGRQLRSRLLPAK